MPYKTRAIQRPVQSKTPTSQLLQQLQQLTLQSSPSSPISMSMAAQPSIATTTPQPQPSSTVVSAAVAAVDDTTEHYINDRVDQSLAAMSLSIIDTQFPLTIHLKDKDDASLQIAADAQFVTMVQDRIRDLTKDRVVPTKHVHDIASFAQMPTKAIPHTPENNVVFSPSAQINPVVSVHRQISTGTAQGTVYNTGIDSNLSLQYVQRALDKYPIKAVMKKSPIYKPQTWIQFVKILKSLNNNTSQLFDHWSTLNDLKQLLVSQFQNINNGAYVDTIGLALGSLLVEAGLSSFFPLFYGSMRVYDNEYFGKGHVKAYGPAINRGFPVQLTFMQVLDGSLYDLIDQGWFFDSTAATSTSSPSSSGQSLVPALAPFLSLHPDHSRMFSFEDLEPLPSNAWAIANNPVLAQRISLSNDEREQILSALKQTDNPQAVTTNVLDCKKFMACFAQIVFGLALAQNVLGMVQNDLHGGNIMFQNVDQNAVLYYYRTSTDTYYAVPTYGKEFKMIDFGRASFDLNGNRIISQDSEESSKNLQQHLGINPVRSMDLNNPNTDLVRLLSSVIHAMRYYVQQVNLKDAACLRPMLQFINRVTSCVVVNQNTYVTKNILQSVDQCIRDSLLQEATSRIVARQKSQQQKPSAITDTQVAQEIANMPDDIRDYIMEQCTSIELAIAPYLIGSNCNGGIPSENIVFFDMFRIASRPVGVQRILYID